MNISLKGFSQLVEDMSAALQSASTNLVDVSVGSVVRAIFEANASVVLWLQWLILQVLQTTRASTSDGADLDTWMLDFGVVRLPAARSAGTVTFSRFASNLDASIPLGSVVKTTDGILSFVVTQDNTVSVWNQSSGAYVIPSGVVSVDVPVGCTAGGLIGNVLAQTVNVIAASLPGVDQVSNAGPFSGGEDTETDQALRDRFQDFLLSRSRATLGAVRYAIASVRHGLNVAIEENTDADGSSRTGAFLVVLDDGSGHPSSGLLSDVAAAIEAVRPIGTVFAVIPPQILLVNVSLTVKFVSSTDAGLGIPVIQDHVTTFLNGLPIGKSASITRMAQNAYLAGPYVENISNILFNGSASDIVPSLLMVIRAGQVVVTIDDR